MRVTMTSSSDSNVLVTLEATTYPRFPMLLTFLTGVTSSAFPRAPEPQVKQSRFRTNGSSCTPGR